METQRETALIHEIESLRGKLKSYQSREAEWDKAKQERQQIDITERKQSEMQPNKQLEELCIWCQVGLGRETRVLDLKGEVNELVAQSD